MDQTAHAAELDALASRAIARLSEPDVQADVQARAALAPVAIASDFAIETLARQPALLSRLLRDPAAPLPVPVLDPAQRNEWTRQLRQYRLGASTRLVWRDVHGLDDVAATLAGSTRLAETCLQVALAALEGEFAQRHGLVRDAHGQVQRLVVFGLGKLGGGELNFSSDIDLVYAFEHDGESDGARPLAASDYFARLGQQLAKLLDEVTADGFSHRVDLRLRPFGSAGRVALSFAAMEQYFQREGRDWERYAWQKARPVAGDLDAGDRFLSTLRPFVYRRYLDFGALDGLREMKAAIAAEVARKDRVDDIKRGPGGIREIEFLAQALQLIRGGREPALQERRLLPALKALVQAHQVDVAVGAALREAYLFLRRLENRLQMLADAQTHALPHDALARARLAAGMGFADWDALRAALDAHRARVAGEFAALLAPRGRRAEPGALAAYWRALPGAGAVDVLAESGFADAAGLDGLLRDFARTPGVRELPDAARARLDRVMPALLQAAGSASQPDAALRRVLALLQNILRRSSYLALLDEQPQALARLVDAISRSALLGERVAMYPLLLDELLDARVSGDLPGREALARECEAAVAGLEDDVEAALHALNERRQALGFRIGLATLDDRQPAADSARQLAWLADAVIAIVVRLAMAEVERAHGRIAGARFAVLGYGSLGGEELGFGSDLDLVFLYDLHDDAHEDVDKDADAALERMSDGARALDAPRWFARLAQKVVALLGSITAAGKLYEVDVRLRPDGGKGLLVSTLASFSEYQRERAWVWEHQALVRARCVAGDAGLCAAFERLRGEVLGREREADAVRAEVVAMRVRMRAELDRSDAVMLDLKQGAGGLVDLEFVLQSMVLCDAAHAPGLLAPRATPALLDAAAANGLIDAQVRDGLQAAHATLVDAGLRCTLDRRRRMAVETDAIAAARAAISATARALALDFGGGPDA